MPQSQSVQEAVDHFRRQPWCAELIDAPGVRAIMPSCRRTRNAHSGGVDSQDELFRTALNDDGSVPYMLLLYQDPDALGATAPAATGSPFLVQSTSLLFDLQEGVKGFTGFAHGGFLGATMDEAMGTLLFCNFEYQREQAEKARAAGHRWTPPPGVLRMDASQRLVTASMDLRFQRPVVTPSFVVATATMNRFDGRKVYVDVVVRDATGAACATCAGMWMSIPPPKRKSNL